jgi:tetratricopeptide (TPR) repeat protein
MQTDGELIRQARGFFESGDFSNAEQAYRALFEQLPEAARPDVLVVISACQRAQGRTEDGLATLRQAVELDDQRAESWFQLGCAQREAGDEATAAESFDRAIELNPNHALARLERGRQAMAAGDMQAAEAAFRVAVKADPDSVPALVALADVRLSEGKQDEARELASKAVQLNPDNKDAQIVMARVFQALGHLDFAEQCLNNALEREPRSAALHRAMAQVKLARGRSEEALESVAEARRQGSEDSRLLALEAQALKQLGQVQEARSRLEALAKAGGMNPRQQLDLAELRLAARDFEGARELAGSIQSQWPAAARLIEAQLAEAGGDRAAAAEMAAELHQEADPYLQRQARLTSARLALAEGDMEACIAAVEPLAADERQSDPFVRWMLARALDRVGRHKEARKHLASTGWRTPPQVRARKTDLPDALFDAVENLSVGDWPRQAPDDRREQPVFLLGWSGSGREALLAALAEQPGLKLLSLEETERRREAINWPAMPHNLQGMDDDQVRSARRRYFRGLESDDGVVVEPMWLPLAALPGLARYFPGATVILADADLKDLELHWRLQGFSGLDTLRHLWRREQAVLDHLLEELPLDVLIYSRGDLERDPEGTASELARPLGLNDPAPLAASLAGRMSAYRPVGHWRHYADLFDQESDA